MPKRSASELENEQNIASFNLLLGGKDQKMSWAEGLRLLELVRTKVQKKCPANCAIPRDVWWLFAQCLLKETYKGAILLPQICKEWKKMYESTEFERFLVFGSTHIGRNTIGFLLGLDTCRKQYFASLEFDFRLEGHTWVEDSDGEESRMATLAVSFLDKDSLIVRLIIYSAPRLESVSHEIRKTLKVNGITDIKDVVRCAMAVAKKVSYCEATVEFTLHLENEFLGNDMGTVLASKFFPRNESEVVAIKECAFGKCTNLPEDHILNQNLSERTIIKTQDMNQFLANTTTKTRLFELLKDYNKIRKMW